jgi:hypothetical protein
LISWGVSWNSPQRMWYDLADREPPQYNGGALESIC